MSARTLAKRLLPAPVHRLGSEIVRRGRDFRRALHLRRKHGVPARLLHFGLAPGDDLLCTTVLRELARRGAQKTWMMSAFPELFEGNSDVDRVVPIVEEYRELAYRWSRPYPTLAYCQYDSVKDATIPPKRHILAEMCAQVGITGSIDLRPYLHLTDGEKAYGVRARDAVILQSSGLDGIFPMRNKQWYPERYQEVVDALKGTVEILQLGSPKDPLISGVQDLRGKTSIRQSGALMNHARLYLGNVGFLMHLARAVECPAVIVYGGREAPWQSGYSANTNLYSPVPCAPCWERNKCDFDRKCMDQITATQVLDAVKLRLSVPRGPLPVDQVVI
jgi:ADP-heptose:LPS heptosyltransferase